MAQNSIIGKTTANRLFEGIDVVNSLSHERAFVEQVLINVGDDTCVGIDAGLAAEKPCIS
jgi:hypothetical protein